MSLCVAETRQNNLTHFDGLVQDCSNSTANALELLQSCTKPSIWFWWRRFGWWLVVCSVPCHGPLTRYVKLWVAHAPGMPGTFSPPPTSKETASSRHASRNVRHARAVMHIRIVNPRCRGKHSRHSRHMRNPQFCVSGKRSIASNNADILSNGSLRNNNSVISRLINPMKWGWKWNL